MQCYNMTKKAALDFLYKDRNGIMKEEEEHRGEEERREEEQGREED